ncbi:transferrin-binding protein-like solute binding protein [Sphingomonas yunnanensis]|uniref:transferrin-binding protein-like solute binding protein n=1 Tax=Sphingomonas yunnanensis TaxID=310400 RepID=UPI001CA69E71|nr:transferrin-binding protein-like solute binding protein [Sphingomonas yunnanensis]MBY9061824.1 transferrin-binding protein-like solute binding protein [Sphingomonas yunnanensis]
MPSELSKYSFFALAEYIDAKTHRVYVIGSPTNPAEVNQPVILTYFALVGEIKNKADASGKTPATAQLLTIDLAKNTVSGTIPVVDADGKASDFNLSGTIDGLKHVSGTLKSADGTVTGEFHGRPYGAGGKELAGVVAIKRSDGTYWYSTLTGALKQ